jgi:hypothetical protein
MNPSRSQICVRCEFEFQQSTNPATGIHRKLCAAPGTDSAKWLVMDRAFMTGAEANCPKGKWADAPVFTTTDTTGTTQNGRKDLTDCAPCKEKMLAAMKADGLSSSVHRPSSISVVIASLNERENLVATVASVKHDCPEAEIIVVDDGSKFPEPIATIRNPMRLGGPRSRRLGALRATSDVVIFLDAHNALDWETACWFAEQYPEIPPVRLEFKAALDRPHKLRTLAAAALERQAIVYGGCMFTCDRAGACLVPEKGLLGGRWMKRRPDVPKLELWPTSLLMGAFYAIPRTVLDRFGGWPALPNYHGAQELAVALLAAAHQVPILFHDGVALWHLFRGSKTGVSVPFGTTMENGTWLGYAAAWRLVLDDAHWKDYRARMAAGQGPHGEIPEHVLAQVETEEFNRYRADAQSRFKLNSDELLAELDRRIAADRETRVQGAEDKTLNQGKKILLAISFAACDGTTSTDLSLEGKRDILGRCLESGRASGADAIVVAAVGDAAAMRVWPELAGIQVLDGGPNPRNGARGESALMKAAILYAQKEGFEWIVKAGGDTFHVRPNWAKEMVRRAMGAPGGAALISGACNNHCAVTKVFAARTDFLLRTWPSVDELPGESVIERVWAAKISEIGLDHLWLALPAHRVIEGRAHWWLVDDPALAYEHTHDAAVAAKWRMEKS